MKTISLICLLALGLSSVRAADAVEAYSKNCASCHGKDGAGKTKAGKQVSVGDLTDAAHQKSFTDEEAFTSIKNGMKDKNGKEQMKPFAEKLMDDEIKGLVAYVRTLAK